MKRFRFVAAISLLALALAWFGPAPAVKAVPEVNSAFVPGEVIVTYAEGTAADVVAVKTQALARAVGAEVAKTTEGMALLRFAEDQNIAAAVEMVKSYPDVAWAEPNYLFAIPDLHPSSGYVWSEAKLRSGEEADSRDAPTRTITFSKEQLLAMRDARIVDGKIASVPQWPSDVAEAWHFWPTDYYLVWNNAAASPRVCVVDTGADVAHPDLSGRVLNGYDFIYGDSVANDDNGHGTAVAGIIAAKINNGTFSAIGMSKSIVYAVKAIDFSGVGTAYDLAAGIKWCANNAYVKVINLSWGGSEQSVAIYNALYFAVKTKGKFVSAAAGNTGTTDYFYPAAYGVDWVAPPVGATGYPVNYIHHGLMAVAATTWETVWVDINNDDVHQSYEDFSNCLADFSTYGEWVEMGAPGVDIFTTLPVSYNFWMHSSHQSDAEYDNVDGTSMAAPIVAAAAARVWGLHPLWKNTDINDQLWWESNYVESHEDHSGSVPEGARRFCWPDTMYETSSFLTFAGVMDLGGILTNAIEGTSGIAVTGAMVRAVDHSSGSVRDIALTDENGYATLINLSNAGSTRYDLQVSKAGYTTGFTTYWKNITIPWAWIASSLRYTVPLVASKYWVVTVNWRSAFVDLDTRLYLPATSPDAGYINRNLGILYDRPYARGYRNWIYYPPPQNNAILIRPKTGTTYPWYYTYGNYTLLIRYKGSSVAEFNDQDPVVRIWYGGVIKKIINKSDICAAGEYDWLVGTIRTGITEINNCGSNLAPYAVDTPIYSTAEAGE